MSEPAKPAAPAVPPRPSVLSLNINSKSALYAGYMPHLKNGGIGLRQSVVKWCAKLVKSLENIKKI